MAKNTSGLKPPWKPGDPSPNPGGRPKKKPITDEYHVLANVVIPEAIRKRLPAKVRPPKGTTFSQATSLNMWILSWLKDGHRAAKELREAMEGKAPQRIDLSGTQTVEQILRVVFEKRLKSVMKPDE